MGVYIPLKVRLAKASIPQVVAYIQTYLEDNPIPSMETFAELIAEFLADHPELVAVASVNAKTGAVILTGADIMLNSDADVTLNTEITNLNSMIASLSSQVAQAVATVGGFDTTINVINDDIDTINVALDTKDTEIYQINQTLTNHLNGINANNTKNEQQDTRLTAIEGDISTLEAYNTATQETVALHTQQITALQGMIGDTTEILERLEEVEQTAENAQTVVSSMQSTVSELDTFCNGISSFEGLRIEFGAINVTGEETIPGVAAFTFKQPFTNVPFVALSIDGYTNRTISVHTNDLTATGGNVVCKRIVDGTGTSGWGGSATVRYMAIGR